MEYVSIGRHSPEMCPDSNARVREQIKEGIGKLEELGKKHHVKMVSTHILSPTHLSVSIYEADTIEYVRDFLNESGITQWNDIELYPSQTMQEAMEQTDKYAPIF